MLRAMRIRLQDVASRARVSEATVSRVLNGKPGVSPATRTRVLGVLAELGYEPAELHGATRVGLVGLIVPELDNPVFPAYAQVIEARLLAQGYVAILCCAGRVGASEDDYVAILLDRGVKGIIFVSGGHADIHHDNRLYEGLLARATPLVLVNGHIDGLGVASVSCDDDHASAAAVRHLVELGHERIGLLVGPVCYTPVLRKIDGFRRTMGELGLSLDEHQIAETMFSVEGGVAGARGLLDAGCTGIVTASDMLALGAIRGAREQGFDVPRDVSVIGYDDTDLIQFTDPPLTTMRQPVLAMGDLATRLLVTQINGTAAKPREYLVRPELIVRGSTGRARVAASAR
jgi:alanine racemase